MTRLAMALFAEGCTDHQFIRIVAQRTAEYILNDNTPMAVADPFALAETMGCRTPPTNLGFPHRPEQVERFADPKAKLKEAISIAQSDRPRRRRRDLKIGELYEPMAETVELDRLARVPAYTQFKKDLTQALHELHFF